MSPEPLLTWVNGEIRAPEDAMISIFDRGLLFGDSVYELVRFFDGVGVGMDLHVARLSRSLAEVGIIGFDAEDYRSICDELLAGLGTGDACVYLQVTRGVQMPRRHLPEPGLEPTVIAIATPSPALADISEPARLPVALMTDPRRDRCDIKATSLLDNVMMMIRADEVNADEPVMHRNGILTEGASSNVFILRGGRLLTPALDDPRPILAGVTRQLVIEAAESLGHPVGVEDIPVEAFRTAEEAFVSSSRRLVAAITSIDGIPVHDGEPGAVTMDLLRELHRRIGADTGTLQGR